MADDLPPRLRALHRALHDEERAEREALDAMAHQPLEDRIAAGHSLPLLQWASCERVGRHHRAELRAPRGVVLHDGLGPGDPIWAIVAGRATPGTCLGHDGRVVEVELDDPLPEGPRVELRRRADPST